MILERKLNYKKQFSDFAVLYRSNKQARILEFKLQHFKIPYKLSGGTSFFARSEIRDLMAYLRLLINPDDDNALLRIINVPRRRIGPTTLEVLGGYAQERQKSLYSCIPEMGLTTRLDPEATRRLSQFYDLVEGAKHNLVLGRGIQAIDGLLDDINYRNWLSDQSASESVADHRWGNVTQLLEALRKDLKGNPNEMLNEDETNSDDSVIEIAIRKLILGDILEQEEEEDHSDRVQLSTLHAAKGLEFPDVFLVGAEEELLPHKNSIETDSIEEERRLMYVGVTRAKQNLTITYARKRKQFGELLETTPSRFLDELPEEYLHWQGKTEQDPEVVRKKVRDSLRGVTYPNKRRICVNLFRPIIIGIHGVKLTESEKIWLPELRAYGVILFSRNVESPSQLRQLCDSIRDLLGDDVVIMIDQEGGRVQRLKDPHWPRLPSALQIGKLWRRHQFKGLEAANSL